jgi:hypothetical protein
VGRWIASFVSFNVGGPHDEENCFLSEQFCDCAYLVSADLLGSPVGADFRDQSMGAKVGHVITSCCNDNFGTNLYV